MSIVGNKFDIICNTLIFGARSIHINFPCSIKYSKSKNYKVSQTLKDYGTKK